LPISADVSYAALAIGLFLLLYPRSPIAIALLRSYGPRTDYRALLPDELRSNAGAWLSYAMAAALEGLLLILVGELAGSTRNSSVSRSGCRARSHSGSRGGSCSG
jgi:hypothetical protein